MLKNQNKGTMALLVAYLSVSLPLHCYWRKLSMEELRQIMERQITSTNEKFGQEIVQGLRNATTYTDLIFWATVDIEKFRFP